MNYKSDAMLLSEQDGILILSMNSAGNNLMTSDFFKEYEAVMAEIESLSKTESYKGLILKGEGRHFSVGADVASLAERSANEIYDDATGILPEGHIKQKHFFTFLRELPFPVISVVTGFCIGSGSEIAVNSHYRIVEKGARIGQPESTFGILPALGGVARTIEICGKKNAYRLVMSGELVSAEEAYSMGWADIYTGKKQGFNEAVSLIEYISQNIAEFRPADYKSYISVYLDGMED